MMTLAQVRDVLIYEAEWYESRLGDYKTPDFRAMADAIDVHLSQPQPVAQGEAVAKIFVCTNGYSVELAAGVDDLPDGAHWLTTMNPKVEVSDVEANAYKVGFANGFEDGKATIPTDHRVVPDGWEIEDAGRGFVRIKSPKDELHIGYMPTPSASATTMLRDLACAMLAASPSAGGV